jgi:ADP-ribosylglycohydrolase
MRVSPVGLVFNDLSQVRSQARRSAKVTHNHPEGVKGAEATAVAVFLARAGEQKNKIRAYIQQQFGYDLSSRRDPP